MREYERLKAQNDPNRDRDSARRKYQMDYERRPGTPNDHKSSSYIYTGYYYAIDLSGTKLSFRQVKWLYLFATLIELVAAVVAGFLQAGVNYNGWLLLPYVCILLSAGMSFLGASELLAAGGEEFVRRFRDKGARRFAVWQLFTFTFALCTAAGQVVWLVNSRGGKQPDDTLFMLAVLLIAAASLYFILFVRRHPSKIVRDGHDDYVRILKELEAQEKSRDPQDE